MADILDVIKSIRESFYGSTVVYTNGSCYHFFNILKTIFPNAIAYYKNDHIVTKIGNKFYDITGEVKGDFIKFNLIASFIQKNIKTNKFGVTGFIECPHCNEHFKAIE